MNFSQVKNNNHSVQLVDSETQLKEVCSKLLSTSEFAFDTEFNRFRWEYGFKLYLLQIFDGETCYLIDPLKLKNLQPLWKAFEHPGILKVLYSGKEDIDLIKRYGCQPRNIFDVQIASRICNHPAVSFSKLVLAEFGIQLDKSEQTSNWKQRPLTFSQQHYASNDVIYLLRLKNIFMEQVLRNGTQAILNEENLWLEQAETADFVPRLSDKQRASYSEHHKEKLLKLILIRDKKGQELNLPPFKVVNDEVLEDIIQNPVSFRNSPTWKGFSKKALEDGRFREQIGKVAGEINEELDWNAIAGVRDEQKILEAKRERLAYETLFKPLKEWVMNTYGAVAGEFYLLGTREAVCSLEMDLSRLKNYQQAIIKEGLEQIRLSKPKQM